MLAAHVNINGVYATIGLSNAIFPLFTHCHYKPLINGNSISCGSKLLRAKTTMLKRQLSNCAHSGSIDEPAVSDGALLITPAHMVKSAFRCVLHETRRGGPARPR